MLTNIYLLNGGFGPSGVSMMVLSFGAVGGAGVFVEGSSALQ